MPECKVCGHKAKNLSKHIKITHNLSVAYYKAKFPEAEIIDPELRAKLQASFATARQRKKDIENTKQKEGKNKENILKESKLEENRNYTKESLDNYTSFKNKYMEEYGFQESPELEELLFFLVTNKTLQKEYNTLMIGNPASGQAADHLKNIRDNNKRIQDLIIILADLKSSRDKTKDVVDLHGKTMKDAEKFKKANMGEFALRCGSCGNMIDTMGFPHPFFDKYTVFSKELWNLVLEKKIPVEYMAYVLHTSIEGVINTARIRGDKIPEINVVDAEANLQELMHGQGLH